MSLSISIKSKILNKLNVLVGFCRIKKCENSLPKTVDVHYVSDFPKLIKTVVFLEYIFFSFIVRQAPLHALSAYVQAARVFAKQFQVTHIFLSTEDPQVCAQSE